MTSFVHIRMCTQFDEPFDFYHDKGGTKEYVERPKSLFKISRDKILVKNSQFCHLGGVKTNSTAVKSWLW